MNSILIVDDEKSLRDFLVIMLEEEGYRVITAPGVDKAIKLIRENIFDLILTDIRMGGSNGIDVLDEARNTLPDTPVVMMTAYASAETAVIAMKKGAYDYISKPFKIEDIQLIVKNALEKRKLAKENRLLKSALDDRFQLVNILGKSEPIQKIFNLVEKVAKSKATVLITGESGTGKELIAKAIHFNGNRKNYPFVSVNCGAMPESLLESELFGHEKGAFTSADSLKLGLMESANKGTFFLDEIGNAPLSTQVKLLRVLQENEITRLGSTKALPVDLRIIAATNSNLPNLVEEKSFREDLYYRLNVIPIHLPPLRERKEDIPELVEFFINKYNARHNKAYIQGIDPDALKVFESYSWPGNVRELENVIERAVVLETEKKIRKISLPDELLGQISPDKIKVPEMDQNNIDLEKTLDQIEKKMIVNALMRSDGIINKAAKNLNLSFRSMRYRIEKHKLKNKGKTND
ncbi:MAG: sigma-54-dependent Fis family transcriptional regulator [Nitrospina sp.]|jgi:two-component system, NtrC family, response regulator PilR|nr:sigma-54-dependent Fis family transcriptional regulator [Nitrospina sp.]MBT5632014.1 sigma-54-dependent Fis family transcriptional regulator [Nitrospina sp.]